MPRPGLKEIFVRSLGDAPPRILLILLHGHIWIYLLSASSQTFEMKLMDEKSSLKSLWDLYKIFEHLSNFNEFIFKISRFSRQNTHMDSTLVGFQRYRDLFIKKKFKCTFLDQFHLDKQNF